MDKQKFIDLVCEWIGKMYAGEMSGNMIESFGVRLGFIRAVRDFEGVPVDVKQDIKGIIESTLLRENVDEIEQQISIVMARHGMELPKLGEHTRTQSVNIISDIIESKKKMFFDVPQKKNENTDVVVKPVAEPVVEHTNKYSEDALNAVKDAIFLLEILVSSDPDSEYRFIEAVKNFHSVLNNSRKIPSELARQFTELEYQPFSGQENYVNTLNREYERCKKFAVKQEIKEKPFIINEDGEIIFNPKLRAQNPVKKTTTNSGSLTIGDILNGRRM